MSIANTLADWAAGLKPTDDDLALADRALLDTVAVAVAAREHPVRRPAGTLPSAAAYGTLCHVADFDDLHMPSTTHISTVCVPTVLALGGGPVDYLRGAGVMARVGTMVGWPPYEHGWHATCLAGAIGSAAAAASALGLGREATMNALALAVPASGGVRRAFGTDAKSLQVGLAAQAGVTAARLAAAGATADPGALEAWAQLIGSASQVVEPASAAVPDGLAIKIYPCCYALQRPIAATLSLRERVGAPEEVTRIVVRTPAAAVLPLHHHRPTTGLEAKFSLEYAVAAALLDEHPGFASFSDAKVQRAEAQRLLRLVELEPIPDDRPGLLTGDCTVTVEGSHGAVRAWLELPPGAPARPPTPAQLQRKIDDCLAGSGISPEEITWSGSAAVLDSLTTTREGH